MVFHEWQPQENQKLKSSFTFYFRMVLYDPFVFGGYFREDWQDRDSGEETSFAVPPNDPNY